MESPIKRQTRVTYSWKDAGQSLWVQAWPRLYNSYVCDARCHWMSSMRVVAPYIYVPFLPFSEVPSYLTRCVGMFSEYPWSEDLREFSGFSVRSLSRCVIHLHKKWWVFVRFVLIPQFSWWWWYKPVVLSLWTLHYVLLECYRYYCDWLQKLCLNTKFNQLIQGQIQEYAKGGRSLPLPFFSPISLSLPSPLDVGPLKPARWHGERCKLS